MIVCDVCDDDACISVDQFIGICIINIGLHVSDTYIDMYMFRGTVSIKCERIVANFSLNRKRKNTPDIRNLSVSHSTDKLIVHMLSFDHSIDFCHVVFSILPLADQNSQRPLSFQF